MERLKAKKEHLNEPMEIEGEKIFEFAEQHYHITAPKKANWNGRQIRNALQTAAALAEFEADQETQRRRKSSPGANLAPVVPELKVMHFDRVAWASFQFDKYLAQTHSNFTDAQRAYFNEEGSDQFRASNGSILRMVNQSGPAYARAPAVPAQRGRQQLPARQHSQPPGEQLQDESQPSYLTDRYVPVHETMYSPEDDSQYDPSWQETSSWPTATRTSDDYPGDPNTHSLHQPPRHQHVEHATVTRSQTFFERDGYGDY